MFERARARRVRCARVCAAFARLLIVVGVLAAGALLVGGSASASAPGAGAHREVARTRAHRRPAHTVLGVEVRYAHGSRAHPRAAARARRPARALQAALATTPTPPFTQCPAVGASSSCAVLIDVTDAGPVVLSDPSQGTYDGDDDTLVGVQNDSSNVVSSILLSSNADITGFDGDGLCTYLGCDYGPTGYEGPGTSFSDYSSTFGGVVSLGGGLGLQPGASAYFSLEDSLSSSQVTVGGPGTSEQGQARNESESSTTCSTPRPVNCGTGDFWHTFTDVSIPGRGASLELARTYDAARAQTDGPFGFGWTDSYDMFLTLDGSGNATITQEDGSTVSFASNGGGGFTAPPRVLATLMQNPDGSYAFVRDHQGEITYTFDSAGRLTSETDTNGEATTLTYAGGKLVTVTDSSGRSLTFTYSGSHISRVTDPLGRHHDFAYDVSGDLVSATDPAGDAWTFGYDAQHRLDSMTDPRGGATANTYDSSGRVARQVDPAGLVTTFAYVGDPTSASGSTTTLTDPHGDQTIYAYANLELVSVTRAAGTSAQATTSYSYEPATLGHSTVVDPDGDTTTNTFDIEGNRTSSTDALGRQTSYSYNAFGELTDVTTPLGESTITSYDASGNPTSETDPNGDTTTFAHDDPSHPGDLTSVTDADGDVTTFTYDAGGDVASRTVSPAPGVFDTVAFVHDADGELLCSATADATADAIDCPANGSHVPGVATRTYDADGHLSGAADESGHVTTYAYDAAGELVSTTDPDHVVVHTAYDPDGRVSSVTRGYGTSAAATTTYAYDLPAGGAGCPAGAGAVYCARTTDPLGGASTDVFDAADHRVAHVRPGGQTTSFRYDAVGNRTATVDPAGRTRLFAYDAALELVRITFDDGTSPVAYGYDEDGRRQFMSDGTGSSTFGYDPAGQLVATTDGAGASTGYTYDPAGNLTAITYPNGQSVLRTFDGAGRLVALADWDGRITSFAYDADGNLVSTAYPNGDTVANTFDAASDLSGTVASSASGPILTLAYTHTAANRFATARTSGALGTTLSTYGYDARGDLQAGSTGGYAYDSASDPTSLASQVQSFDGSRQLVASASAGSGTAYAYDALGERTSSTAPSGQTTDYAYDESGELTRVSSQAGGQTVVARPVVTRIAPTLGPVGTVVSIDGSGFTAATGVTFGGVPASYSVGSDSSIVATAPDGSGTVDVVVTTGGGSSQSGPADQFTFTPRVREAGVPVITGVSPVAGPRAGGTRVTLSGTAFAGATSVRIGGASARIVSVSPTSLRLIVPAGRGASPVVVTTPAGSSSPSKAARYTYLARPFVRAVSPASGRAGRRVTISGSNLVDVVGVRFGTAHAAFRSRSARTITATVPKQHGRVDVTVVTLGGTSAHARRDRFHYAGSASKARAQASAGATSQVIATYTYDGSGLRATAHTASGTQTFSYDLASGMPLLLADGSSSFIDGPEGLPVEQVDASGTPLYFVHDETGSTRALLAADGGTAATFIYSDYGRLISSTGAASTPLLFGGGYHDDATGFTYLVARYYDPATAQFVTVDPALAVTGQPYGYADADPVDNTDPLGLLTVNDCYSGSLGAFHLSASLALCFNFGSSGYSVTDTKAVGVSKDAFGASVADNLGLSPGQPTDPACPCGVDANVGGFGGNVDLSRDCDGNVSGSVGIGLGLKKPGGSVSATQSTVLQQGTWSQLGSDWYTTVRHPTTIWRGLGL